MFLISGPNRAPIGWWIWSSVRAWKIRFGFMESNILGHANGR